MSRPNVRANCILCQAPIGVGDFRAHPPSHPTELQLWKNSTSSYPAACWAGADSVVARTGKDKKLTIKSRLISYLICSLHFSPADLEETGSGWRLKTGSRPIDRRIEVQHDQSLHRHQKDGVCRMWRRQMPSRMPSWSHHSRPSLPSPTRPPQDPASPRLRQVFDHGCDHVRLEMISVCSKSHEACAAERWRRRRSSGLRYQGPATAHQEHTTSSWCWGPAREGREPELGASRGTARPHAQDPLR